MADGKAFCTPKRKLTIDKCSFRDEKERYRRHIEEHPFNHAVCSFLTFVERKVLFSWCAWIRCASRTVNITSVEVEATTSVTNNIVSAAPESNIHVMNYLNSIYYLSIIMRVLKGYKNETEKMGTGICVFIILGKSD